MVDAPGPEAFAAVVRYMRMLGHTPASRLTTTALVQALTHGEVTRHILRTTDLAPEFVQAIDAKSEQRHAA